MFNNDSFRGTSSSSSSDEYTTPSELTDDFEHLIDEEDNIKEVVLNQYAQKVLDFSSQYGSDYSISYTACNITGRPSKYPNYGDFPETFAMRTYGKWWDKAPSRITEIMPQTMPENIVQDYIVVQFEEFVFPEEIRIFETFNPGAVCKIWAFTMAERWVCLWDDMAKPVKLRCQRVFSPPIKHIKVPTKIVRIDFNHQFLDYFTEIDGVMLIGKKFNCAKFPGFHQFAQDRSLKGPIQRKLESVKFKPRHVNDSENYLNDYLIKDLENFLTNIESEIEAPDDCETAQFTLQEMPSEIQLKICSYLDLVSLFRVSRTCRKLRQVACDPSLYNDVNLKPYWHLVESDLMCTLSKRCKYLKKFDASWCGLFKNLTSTDFREFIRVCGKQLTHLRLNSAKFLNAGCLETVGNICDNLKELSLRNATINTINVNSLSRLTHLERLDLFRANVADQSILMILIKNNPKLKHLNFGFGGTHINMDEVALTITQYNKSIISIDMWKSHGLSSIGLLALSNCVDLEEVDFGWCLREEASPGDSLKALLKGCSKMKKLFLAAIRGLTDRDLENIALLCPNLEQLDLLGVMGISTEKCYGILCSCKRLELIDLSFCDHLDDNQLAYWRDRFNVNIKRSFVLSDVDFGSSNNI